jgi:hypothetical protein
MEKRVGLESAPITSTRMETLINRSQIRSNFVTLSSNPRRRPLPSPCCYPLSEALSLAGGAWSSPTLMQSLSRTTPPTLAAIVARRPPKMSKIGSPCRLNVIGENLIENRGPDSRIRPTPVSRHHGPATPLTEAPPPRPESPLAVCSPTNAVD